jgi:hypothetical protein
MAMEELTPGRICPLRRQRPRSLQRWRTVSPIGSSATSSPERFAELDKLGAFRGRDLDPLGKLRTQDSVLGKQVFDDLSQFLVREMDDQKQQGMHEAGHGDKIP